MKGYTRRDFLKAAGLGAAAALAGPTFLGVSGQALGRAALASNIDMIGCHPPTNH